MSEKRFTFEYDDGQWGVPLFYDDGKKLCFDDVVDLLNEQQATIKELEEEIKLLKPTNIEQYEQIQKLQEENKQLKIANAKWLDKSLQDKQIRYTNANCKELTKKYLQLKEENEKLRQTMQKVCELLEKEVDLFSDEATEHDVIAYCEMQDFDNKDAYYICTATKKAIQMLKGRDSDE